MDFKGQPFLDDREFLLQSFDNTFADIAEGSNVVGIDRYLHGVHSSLLCPGCLSAVPILFMRGHDQDGIHQKAVYMAVSIIYIDIKSSTYLNIWY